MPTIPDNNPNQEAASKISSTVNRIYSAREKEAKEQENERSLQEQAKQGEPGQTSIVHDPAQVQKQLERKLDKAPAPSSPWKVMDSRDNAGIREETALLDVGCGVVVRSTVGIGSGAHQSVSSVFIPGAEIINGNKIRQK